MILLPGFELYENQRRIDLSSLYSPAPLKSISSYIKYVGYEPFCVAPVSNTYVAPKSSPRIDLDDFKSIMTTVNDGDVVYCHPNCKIPRDKVRGSFTLTRSAFKADKCVVPISSTIAKMHYKWYTDPGNILYLVVFLNRENGILYFDYTSTVSLPNTLSKCIVGTSILDYTLLSRSTFNLTNPNDKAFYNSTLTNKQEVESMYNSVCVFSGFVICYNQSTSWIKDFADGRLKNIVDESSLLSECCKEYNSIDSSVMSSIDDMLSSSDSDTVALGVKTLSELDYVKYPNAVKYLLKKHSRDIQSANVTLVSSIKFMLMHFDTAIYRLQYIGFSDKISSEDYDLIKDIILEDTIKDSEKRALSVTKYPFLDMKVDVKVEVSPKLIN